MNRKQQGRMHTVHVGGRQVGKTASQTEELIRNLMKQTKRRGDPRDYVIFTGTRMMDMYGSYTLPEEAVPGYAGVVLSHKRDMHKIVGEEMAKDFWNKRLRRRVNRPALIRAASRMVEDGDE